MTQPIPGSWTWGSSCRVISYDDLLTASQQLAAVTLPEPAIVSIYFQVSIVRRNDAPAPALQSTIRSFTINLAEGIGRVTIPRQISFDAQPADDAPIEFTIPFLPVHALQVNVQQMTQNVGAAPPPPADPYFLETECYMVLAPLTRIAAPPEAPQEFGMALPGEADSLDDDLLDELEAEAPSVAEMMVGDRLGTEPVPEVELVEPEGPTPARLIVDRIVARLTRRLGRKPTRSEAIIAIGRAQRRLDRGGR
jgi:hypothetical protein